jgi:hypothetical protein
MNEYTGFFMYAFCVFFTTKLYGYVFKIQNVYYKRYKCPRWKDFNVVF